VGKKKDERIRRTRQKKPKQQAGKETPNVVDGTVKKEKKKEPFGWIKYKCKDSRG
jgi:hypothetical protein